MNLKWPFTLLLACILTGNFLSAQVIINEFSASNYSGIVDNFGQTEDWVELYNVGNNTVNLGGYFLSDNIDNPTKWTFPSNVSIDPGENLLIFLSDRDLVAGGTIHAGFKLTQAKQEWLVLTNPSGTLLDAIQLTNPTQMNHSRGRVTDGSSDWGIFLNPSPGGSNGTAFEEYASKPILSLEAGFYSNTVTISMSVTNNETIRYTTNGSEPTSSSSSYNSPISVAQTTVVKAKSFSNVPFVPASFTEANTYFIGITHTIPVISIAGDDVEDLLDGMQFDPIGSFELFHEDGSFWTEAYGDFNKHGNDSWAYPQRGIDYVTRDQLGYESSLDAAIFPTRDRNRYQRLIIKAAANDNYPFEGGAHIRDAYIQMLSQNADMEMDERTSEPCILYLNGEYWGVYELREKVDDPDYTNRYFNQGEKWLDYLKTWGGTWEEYGSRDDWDDLHDFITGSNMASANNYQQAADELNMTSLVDYMIINTHMVCKDWLNYNTAWWRGRNPEGEAQKWRYTLWDMDAALGHYINYTNIPDESPTADPCGVEELSNFSDPQGHVDLITSLLQNEEFHSLYVNRYADMNNSFLSCDYMISLLDEMINRIAPEMPMQIDRWGGSMSGWEAEVQELRDFILARCSFIDDGIVDCYDVAGPFLVTVNVEPQNSPNAVRVNTFVPAEFPFIGDYFSGTTLTFEALTDDSDWVFDHWEVANNSFAPDQFAEVISLQLANNGEVVTAFFEENIPCVPFDCDDNCDETMDTFNEDICDCEYTIPDCDDNCESTTDSFNIATCGCENTPIDCDDACILTTDSFNFTTCECENIAPDCNDNCPETVDSFNENTCECENTSPDCDDNCVLTTDSFNIATCGCENTPIDCDDACILTTDSFNFTTCECENIAPDCNDNCPETVDSFNENTCECENTSPDCDDNCVLTTDSFNIATCGCENTPIDCDDACILTADSFNFTTCECENIAPDCNDNCLETVDSFNENTCECENELPNCDDACALTTDFYNTNTCECENTPPNPDDNCPLTTDSFDAMNCVLLNIVPNCDDNNCATTDSFDTANCICENTPIPPPPFMNGEITLCEGTAEMATFNLSDLNMTVNAGSGNTVTWMDANGQIANPTAYESGSTTVFAEISDEASPICQTSTATVILTVQPQYFAEVTLNTIICNTTMGGSILNLDALITSGDMNGTWTDVDDAGVDLSNTAAVDFDGVTPIGGAYTFLYTTNSAVAPCEENTYPVEVFVEDCTCPSVATNAPTSVLCNDNGLLDLSTLQATTESGTWAITSPISNPPNLTGNIFNANAAPAGDYQITFTLDAAPLPNCPDSSVQIITIINRPNAGISGDTAVCANETNLISLANIIQNEDINGVWSIDMASPNIPSSGSFDVENGTFNSNGQMAGFYTFIYTVENGICDDDIADVVVEILPMEMTFLQAFSCEMNDIGIDTILLQTQYGCDSLVITNTDLLLADTTALMTFTCDPNGVGVSEILLENQAGCDSLLIINTVFDANAIDTTMLIATTCNANETGIFQEILMGMDGCDSLVITETILGDQPDAEVLPYGEISCSITSISLVGQDAANTDMPTFEWQDASGTILSNIAELSINAAGNYTLIVTASNGGCTSFQTIEVIENNTPPTANAGSDIVLDCNGLATVLDGSLSESNGELSFVWQDENGTTINENEASTLEVFAAGNYTLMVTNLENGCTNSQEVTVSEFSSIDAEDDDFSTEMNQEFSGDLLLNDDLSNQNVVITLENQPEEGTLILNIDGTFSFMPAQDFIGTITFDYTVCVENCEDVCAIATVSIEIISRELIIPDAFSPNDDGINDLYIIPGIEQYPSSSFRVVNRWGDLLYEARPYQNDWNGQTNDGKKLPAGTYYFLLILDLVSEETHQGTVTIVR